MKLPPLCRAGIHAYAVTGFTSDHPPKRILNCIRCGRRAVKA